MIDLDALVLAPNFATWSEANCGYPMPSYTPPGGGPAYQIDGVFRLTSITIFDAPPVPGMTTRQPELDIRASQVPAGVEIAQEGEFVVRGVAYVVADVRPDGQGLITLALAEAPLA